MDTLLTNTIILRAVDADQYLYHFAFQLHIIQYILQDTIVQYLNANILSISTCIFVYVNRMAMRCTQFFVRPFNTFKNPGQKMQCTCPTSPMKVEGRRVLTVPNRLTSLKAFVSPAHPLFEIADGAISCPRKSMIIWRVANGCWNIQCRNCGTIITIFLVDNRAFAQQRPISRQSAKEVSHVPREIARFIRFEDDDDTSVGSWDCDSDFEMMFSNDREAVVGSFRLSAVVDMRNAMLVC